MTVPNAVLTRTQDVDSLLGEYSSRWQQTLDSLEIPDPESFLAPLPDESRAELQPLIEEVDRRFRRRLAEGPASGDRTVSGSAGDTVLPPSTRQGGVDAAPEPESNRDSEMESQPAGSSNGGRIGNGRVSSQGASNGNGNGAEATVIQTDAAKSFGSGEGPHQRVAPVAPSDGTAVDWSGETLIPSQPPAGDDAPVVETDQDVGPTAMVPGGETVLAPSVEGDSAPPDGPRETSAADGTQSPATDATFIAPVDVCDDAAEIRIDDEASANGATALVASNAAGEAVVDEGDFQVDTQTVIGDSASPQNVQPATEPFTPAASRALPTVPGYDIEGVLGRGGMGVVYKARQTGLNRLVALKMILAGGHAGEEHLARFRSEGEAVARLQHPNIVQIFDVGDSEGLPYFSLEFIDGGCLEDQRDGKPFPARDAAEMVATLANAMHYAHERGIVHRDLKPANILISEDGTPKITDFGLVKRIETDEDGDAGSGETRAGAVMGTPSYMAPEQAWGRTDVGPQADVFALGAILYSLLTGRPPFLGSSALDTIVQVREDDPVSPSRLQPGLPRDLETICMKALQKEQSARYASAQELADDLVRFLKDEPIHARPVSRPERAARWCRRNPWLSTSIGVAAVLALSLMIGGPAAAAMIFKQKELAEDARIEAQDNARIARENELIADQKAAEARAAEGRAKASEANAVASEKLAEENAQKAGVQRNVAVDTLNTVVEHMHDELHDVPQTQKTREKLLTLATKGLDKVAETGGAGSDTDLLMARAHKKMGNVLLETGMAEQAGDQFTKTHQIVLRMAANPDPKKPHVPHLNLGRSYENLGKAAQKAGDAKTARTYFLQSLASREQALPVAPKTMETFVKQEIADAYGRLGTLALAMGQPADAYRNYKEGVALRREWVKKDARSANAVRQLAGSQLLLANTLVDLGRFEEAQKEYAEALETLERVVVAERGSVSSRANVAFTHNQRGKAYLFADKFPEAEEEYKHAVDGFEALIKDDPENAFIQRKLGGAHYGLAATLFESGDKQASDRHFREALKHRRTLVERDPGNISVKPAYALALVRTGDVEAGLKIAEEVEQKAVDDPSLLYFVVNVYALAAASVNEDEALSERYSRKAAAALEKAIEQGFRANELIRVDPEIDAIRNRQDFKMQMKQLPAVNPAPPAEVSARR